MDHVRGVRHPLVRNAARELTIETEFEVCAGIERTVRFGEEPFPPVGILLANLLDLRPSAPAWTVVVPHALDFAHAPESAARDPVPGGALVRFAAMLGADLHHPVAPPH